MKILIIFTLVVISNGAMEQLKVWSKIEFNNSFKKKLKVCEYRLVDNQSAKNEKLQSCEQAFA